ncbi:hypothetical protein DIE21_33030 [Burkholderia sp. Bp9140]|nr:hypothetical protein DIE21_33030 [Burkholderia sp. Bp9140]
MNAVEVMPRTPRSAGVAGVAGVAGGERGRRPRRLALRDGAGAARARPVASCGEHTSAPYRIGTSLSNHVH